MDGRKLTPATHEDLVQSLAFALRYNRSGKRVSDRDIMTSNMAAEHLVSMLKLSGYVVMKGPPAPAHPAPPPTACLPLRPNSVQTADGRLTTLSAPHRL